MVDLREAGARLAEFRPQPTPDLSELYRRRDRRRRRRLLEASASAAAVVAVAAATLATVIPASGHKAAQHVAVSPAPPSTTMAPTAPLGRATVTVTLDQTTVRAGTPIRGSATIDNETGAAIAVPNGTCDGWLFVGLTNPAITSVPASSTVGCVAFNIPTGRSSYPITITTTYQSCTRSPSSVPAGPPACGTSPTPMMPPLPPGVYRTAVVIPLPAGASRPVEDTNPVTVTLTASPSSPPLPTTSPSTTGQSPPPTQPRTHPAVMMPSLVGLRSSIATQDLGALGLIVDTIPQPSTDYQAGTVMAESPAAGSSIIQGSTVRLYVSTGSH